MLRARPAAPAPPRTQAATGHCGCTVSPRFAATTALDRRLEPTDRLPLTGELLDLELECDTVQLVMRGQLLSDRDMFVR